jgi:hypothetical protein
MSSVERYPYVQCSEDDAPVGFRPLLPVTLHREGAAQDALGLLDTGASINVLPYGIGLRLGGNWTQLYKPLMLGGNLASVEARAMLVEVTVGSLPSVELAFAWARTDQVPLILGQVNFFREFEVCFYGARREFDVRRNP